MLPVLRHLDLKAGLGQILAADLMLPHITKAIYARMSSFYY